jgi:addiction module HigA family antidote
MTMDEKKRQIPPCISYKTFSGFLVSLPYHLPAPIDRSYWGAIYSDRTGTQLLSAMRFLNLIDANSRATTRLKVLVPATGAHRAALLRQVAEEAYPFIFKGTIDTQNATRAELEAVFQNTYQTKIDVCHKCIRFFIAFCEDADIPLSSQITKNRKIPSSHQGINTTNKKIDISSDDYHGMAIPPGKYLKYELVARNISQEEFARRMGMSLKAIDEIINDKKAITAETALKLEEVIPTFPARFWLYLQSDFQLAEALEANHSIK